MKRRTSSDRKGWSSVRTELVKLTMGEKGEQKEKKIASRKSQYFKGQAKKRMLMKVVDRENLKRHKGNELLWVQCLYLKDSGSNAIKQKDIW